MLRLVGAALLIGACAWIGNYAAGGLKRRVEALRAMTEALERIERELSFRLASMPELLTAGAEYARPPAQDFFVRCLKNLERLGEQDFFTLWDDTLALAGDVGEDGRSILRCLGTVLGRYDGEGQREALRGAREELTRLTVRAEEERRRMGRVYQTAGLSAGALLAILLL